MKYCSVHVFAAAHVHVKLQPMWWISRVTVQKSSSFRTTQNRRTSSRENERRCERSRSWVQGDWLRPPLVKPLPAAAPPPLMLSSLKLHLSQKQLVFGALDTVGLCKQEEVSYSFWRRRCQNKHVTYPLLREKSGVFVLRSNALWGLMGAHCAAQEGTYCPWCTLLTSSFLTWRDHLTFRPAPLLRPLLSNWTTGWRFCVCLLCVSCSSWSDLFSKTRLKCAITVKTP